MRRRASEGRKEKNCMRLRNILINTYILLKLSIFYECFNAGFAKEGTDEEKQQQSQQAQGGKWSGEPACRVNS
jgi:hypothetical protein